MLEVDELRHPARMSRPHRDDINFALPERLRRAPILEPSERVLQHEQLRPVDADVADEHVPAQARLARRGRERAVVRVAGPARAVQDALERDAPEGARLALVFRQSRRRAYVVEPLTQFVARERRLAELLALPVVRAIVSDPASGLRAE